MKKLFVTALFLMLFGSAFAQSPYAGFGLFFSNGSASTGTSDSGVGFTLHGGVKNMVPGVAGLGARLSMDYNSYAAFGFSALGLAMAVTYDLPMPGSPVAAYLGAGPYYQTLSNGSSSISSFGLHGLLGAEYPLPGTNMGVFAEAVFASNNYSGTGFTSLLLKLGTNIRF